MEGTPSLGQETGRSALVTGVLLGIGIAGFIDEALFHQILQWHNFYWDTGRHGRILSDGLFHVVSAVFLLAGGWRLWQDPHSARPLRKRAVVAGILVGAGGFNAYDGIVQHVILHLHLVNERVCPSSTGGNNTIWNCPRDIPYEIVWITVGTTIALTGVWLWRSVKRDRGGVR